MVLKLTLIAFSRPRWRSRRGGSGGGGRVGGMALGAAPGAGMDTAIAET